MIGLRVLFDNKNHNAQWGTIVDKILKRGSTRYLVKIRANENYFIVAVKPKHIEGIQAPKGSYTYD